MFDLIIIGAGPAGLTCALYSARAGKKVVIFEKSMPGGQVALTTNIENYPSIEKIDGPSLALNMHNQVAKLGVETKFEEVVSCNLEGDIKTIKTNKGEYSAKAVFVATGASAKQLEVENEKKYIGKGLSYCATCDGALYKNKVVAVVGGGNTSFEDCLYLSNIAKKIYLIHRRSEFRGDEVTLDKIKNMALGDNKKVEFVLNSVVTKIKGELAIEKIEVKNIVSDTLSELEIDALFVAIGRKPDTEILNHKIALTNKGHIVTNNKMQTNVNGVFAGGDVRDTPLRQIVTACSDGAIASISINEYLNKINNH